jgi:hypothetical protein
MAEDTTIEFGDRRLAVRLTGYSDPLLAVATICAAIGLDATKEWLRAQSMGYTAQTHDDEGYVPLDKLDDWLNSIPASTVKHPDTLWLMVQSLRRWVERKYVDESTLSEGAKRARDAENDRLASEMVAFLATQRERRPVPPVWALPTGWPEMTDEQLAQMSFGPAKAPVASLKTTRQDDALMTARRRIMAASLARSFDDYVAAAVQPGDGMEQLAEALEHVTEYRNELERHMALASAACERLVAVAAAVLVERRRATQQQPD